MNRFRELFKDEVRLIGRELGVPEEILTRHPFPGPGLAVRIIGEVTEERIRLLQAADRILDEELRLAELYQFGLAGFSGAAANFDGRRDGRRTHL